MCDRFFVFLSFCVLCVACIVACFLCFCLSWLLFAGLFPCGFWLVWLCDTPTVDENDLIGLAKGFGPDLLKVAPTALKAAPAALPLLATALTVPGELLFVGAAGSFAAGEKHLREISDNSRVLLGIATAVDTAATVGYCCVLILILLLLQ